jgi:hypothetical protein
MTSRCDCATAESLAGAIALGEALEIDRESYRRHLAGCRRCLTTLGGEREIERVMTVAAQARDDERWEPDLRKLFGRRRAPYHAWLWAGTLAAAAAVIFGLRATESRPPIPVAHPAISAQEARALAVLDTQTAPRLQARAESLVIGPATLSTAVQVNIDSRGMPTRCKITKSSGDQTLDRNICLTAMRTRYSPHATNGR